MGGIYAKYPLKEIMKIKEEFYNEEIYEVVNKYYNEFASLYPKLWQSSNIIDRKNDIEVPFFEMSNMLLSETLKIPVQVSNYFENLHGINVFYNKTNNFGLESLTKTPTDFHHIYRPNPFISASIFSFYPNRVSSVIHDLLKTEHFKKHLELTIKYELKKHFIRGRISNFWLALDLINRYGFQYIRKYYSISGQYHSLKERTKEKIDEKFQHEMKFVAEHSSFKKKKNMIFCAYEQDKEKYLIDLHGNIKDSRINMPYDYHFFLDHLDIDILDITNDTKLIDEYFSCESGVENEFRAFFGLPNLGEGWVNETKLFHLIKNHFPDHLIIQHGKTPWLKKQHLDIYFPFLNIAIEYHGKQHFEPVEYFGGHDTFLKNQERDSRKKDLCAKHKCHLIEVRENYDIESLIGQIMEIIIIKSKK